MFLVRLANFIYGYVVIIIEGMFPERFLNICARRGIYLWNVKKEGKYQISANISVRGFKMVRPVAKKSRCRVILKKRRGLPFYVFRHRKRKAFALGAVVFVLLLFVMTRFIWVVDISGNVEVETSRIEKVLQEAGLKAGVPSMGVDVWHIQNTVMTRLDKISWIGINIKGTTAYVEVRERISKPEIFPKDLPCDIVASRSGVIESIDAVSGQRLVSIGDVVSGGQLLISGAIDSKAGEGVRYVHAEGEVMATTWHEITVEIPYREEIRTRTGKSKSKHMLKFFNFYVNFFINDRISYENYDRISYVKRLSIGKNLVLPFSFHYDNYYEVEVTWRQRDINEALELAGQEAFEHVKGMQIKNSKRELIGEKLKVTYECLENIALKKAVIREDAKDNGKDIRGGDN
jgi:similar to stage IV sporulation protein